MPYIISFATETNPIYSKTRYRSPEAAETAAEKYANEHKEILAYRIMTPDLKIMLKHKTIEGR